MASRPDPLSLALHDTLLHHIEGIDPSEGIIWSRDQAAKEESSLKIWPKYNQVMELWSEIVRNILKMSVEQCLNSSSLPHYEAARLRGLMHTYLLPYSIEPVTPIFSGVNGIDYIMEEITGVPQNMAHSVHCSNRVFGAYIYERKSCDLNIASSKSLDDLLRMYYGLYGLMSGADPEFFDNLGKLSPMFKKQDVRSDERKQQFIAAYGYHPGDLMHYFYRCVCCNVPPRIPFIHPSSCKNMQSLLLELAPRLRTAVKQTVSKRFNL